MLTDRFTHLLSQFGNNRAVRDSAVRTGTSHSSNDPEGSANGQQYFAAFCQADTHIIVRSPVVWAVILPIYSLF